VEGCDKSKVFITMLLAIMSLALSLVPFCMMCLDSDPDPDNLVSFQLQLAT
jgi:hypothetical protein